MGAWTKNKVESSQINKGQEYAKGDNVPLDQLNAITNNSFYAVDKADEALAKASSAFENNGTVVKVANQPVTNLSFDSDPQIQLNDKANKDLSNVTYPQAIANGVAQTGAGDRVIETYISSDGKSWYRKWASGWKECGIIVSTTGGWSYYNKELPLTFTSTSSMYVTATYIGGGSPTDPNTNNSETLGVETYTTSTISIALQNGANKNVYVCGY